MEGQVQGRRKNPVELRALRRAGLMLAFAAEKVIVPVSRFNTVTVRARDHWSEKTGVCMCVACVRV